MKKSLIFVIQSLGIALYFYLIILASVFFE